jgi:ornithine cyclodeaminase
MGVLFIDQDLVRALLPMEECVPVIDAALRALGRGDAVLPLRPIVPLPDRRGALAAMPGWLGTPGVLGLKAISFFPGNLGTALDCHQGAVLLFDPGNGKLLAILDATAITAIRTAAATGVATAALAREDVRALAILGSGVQARTHVDAMCVVRPFETIRIWSRDAEKARAFADEVRQKRPRLDITVSPDAERAVRGADVVCTVTSAREPILNGEWLAPGMHVNAVGSSIRTAREVDAIAMQRARVYVDRRESALAEAGDFLMAKAEGAVTDDHIVGEIGALLLGEIAGRTSADEITLFKSLGIAIEDLAAAEHVYRKARASGEGIEIDLGGRRH